MGGLNTVWCKTGTYLATTLFRGSTFPLSSGSSISRTRSLIFRLGSSGPSIGRKPPGHPTPAHSLLAGRNCSRCCKREKGFCWLHTTIVSEVCYNSFFISMKPASKKSRLRTGEPLVCKFDAKGNLVSYSYMRWKPKLKDCTQKLLKYCLP